MIDFLARSPTLDANWRAVILFGRNVASYKFALAETLLGFAGRDDDRVLVEELALPYSKHLCDHLRQVDKQATSHSSKFLDACRAFNRGELSDGSLLDATMRHGFKNVIDAFHVVGAGPVPVSFFKDEREPRRGTGAIRITDDLRRLAASVHGPSLVDETEARWRLVEAAWSLDLPRAGVVVQNDAEKNLLYVERVRRVNLTGVQAALNGYQQGRCFYCRAEITIGKAEVDHFFPWILKKRGEMPDADGVWNLVLSCKICNRGDRGKFAAVPAASIVARLHERNNWLVASHHPLRETIMKQTGAEAETRASFLRARQRIALDALMHEWEPAEADVGG